MSNIKYLAFAKSSSSTPILGYSQQSDTIEDLKIQVAKVSLYPNKVLSRLKDFELRPDERQKMKSQFGCWHCKKDSRGMLYMALCSPNYPERHIYAAINQLRDHLNKLGDYETEPDSTLKLHCREFVQQLCKDFEELKGLDKVGAVGGLLNDVTTDMRRNTTQMVDNMFNAEKLQEKSDRLKQRALLFQQTAEDVEINFTRRRCVVRVLLGISALSLILLIIIPIATGTVS